MPCSYTSPFCAVASTDERFCAPQALFDQVVRAFELGGQQVYPARYQRILQTLWEDSTVQKVRARSLGSLSLARNSTRIDPLPGCLKRQETRSPRQVRPRITALTWVSPNPV